MRRTLAVLIAVLFAFAGSAPASAYENRYSPRQKEECRFQRNGSWSRSEVRDSVRCIVRRIGGDVSKHLRVSYCESRHYARAGEGQPDSFRGVYQQHRRYWPKRVRDARRKLRRELGGRVGKSIYNARSNVGVSVVMVKRGGWSPWECA
jgi:hypothetical protein